MLTILASDPSDKSARHKAGDSTTPDAPSRHHPTTSVTPVTVWPGDTLTTRMVTPPRTVRVAIDVGPLHGQRTGIGHAVAGVIGALSVLGPTDGVDRVTVMPYVTSTRAEREPSQRRLPMPAAAALRLWARSSVPVDRWLGRPDVVHGTNYVVPPTNCPRVRVGVRLLVPREPARRRCRRPPGGCRPPSFRGRRSARS